MSFNQGGFVRSVLVGFLLMAGGSVLAQDQAPEEIARIKREYDSRKTSTQALYSALVREDGQPGVSEFLQKIKAQIDQAEQNAGARQYTAANRQLADANAELKTRLIQLKSRPEARPVVSGDPATKGSDLQEAVRIRKEMDTARVLLEALRREPKVSSSDIAAMESDVNASSKLMESGKIHEAAVLLDAAYARAKVLLGQVKESPKMASGTAAMDAAGGSNAGQLDSPALRQKYAQRESSVNSLQAAFGRVAEEKGVSRALLTEIGKLQAEARNAAEGGKIPVAIAALDRAYLLLKTALAELRGGSELTASKTFTTPDQEFNYERERNADYAQLIAGLIERTPDRADWKIQSSRAGQLKDSALKAASSGDWKDALGRMNESTGELKKILRAAGFPIL